MATEDLISELPEPIVHHILSFLPVKDAACTSRLSKRWNRMWETLPCLNFDKGFLNCGFTSRKNQRKKKFLLKVAERITVRRCQQNTSMDKFSLLIPEHRLSKRQRSRQKPLCFKLERWISCVARSGLRELNLRNVSGISYDLPSSILSAKSLTVVSLRHFSLRSLSGLEIKLSSLRKLCLSSVDLDDSIMENLIAGSPSLEDLQLQFCGGLKSIRVARLTKLKLLEVGSVSHLETLKIDAPELKLLEVKLLSHLKMLEIKAPELKLLEVQWLSHLKMVEINAPELVVVRAFDPLPAGYWFNTMISNCARKIRKLRVSGKFITAKQVHQLVSRCLFLEEFFFEVGISEKINISSDSLKRLNICLMENVREVEISCPALESFTFQAASLPTILLNNASSSLHDVLKIRLYFYNWMFDLGYNELAEFLGYFSNFRTVTLNGLSQGIIIPKDKRDNLLSPLCGARNVALIHTPRVVKFTTMELAEYLLWLAPRAENVSITSGANDASFKLVYDDDKSDLEDPPTPAFCCKFLPINCWRHCLTQVRAEKFDEDEDEDEDEMTEVKNFFLQHIKDLKIMDTSSRCCPSPNSFCDGLYTLYDELFVDKEDVVEME